MEKIIKIIKTTTSKNGKTEEIKLKAGETHARELLKLPEFRLANGQVLDEPIKKDKDIHMTKEEAEKAGEKENQEASE